MPITNTPSIVPTSSGLSIHTSDEAIHLPAGQTPPDATRSITARLAVLGLAPRDTDIHVPEHRFREVSRYLDELQDDLSWQGGAVRPTIVQQHALNQLRALKVIDEGREAAHEHTAPQDSAAGHNVPDAPAHVALQIEAEAPAQPTRSIAYRAMKAVFKRENLQWDTAGLVAVLGAKLSVLATSVAHHNADLANANISDDDVKARLTKHVAGTALAGFALWASFEANRLQHRLRNSSPENPS